MAEYGNDAGEALSPVEDGAPGTSVVPADGESEATPEVAPWHQLTPAEIKKQGELVTAPRVLKNWESEYCLVVSALGGWKKVAEKDRIAIASAYARTRVHRKELQALHKRPTFTKLQRKYMGDMPDDVLEELRARAIDIIPDALETHALALSVLRGELKTGKNKLEAVRAAAPLTTPLLDRAYPKKHDGPVGQTNITITLSTHQAARIDAETYQSEAIDVPYEVVSEEASV